MIIRASSATANSARNALMARRRERRPPTACGPGVGLHDQRLANSCDNMIPRHAQLRHDGIRLYDRKKHKGALHESITYMLVLVLLLLLLLLLSLLLLHLVALVAENIL